MDLFDLVAGETDETVADSSLKNTLEDVEGEIRCSQDITAEWIGVNIPNSLWFNSDCLPLGVMLINASCSIKCSNFVGIKGWVVGCTKLADILQIWGWKPWTNMFEIIW